MRPRTVGQLVEEARYERGLNCGDVARALGFRNINKGMRQIIALERENLAAGDLLEKIVAFLELEPSEVDALIAAEEERLLREFEKWVSVRVDPVIHVCVMPGIWVVRPVPPEARTEEEIIEYARKLPGRRIAVELDRLRTVWIERGKADFTSIAEPGKPNVPYMTLGGSNKKFTFVQE
ncbi:MAG: hypothetical protein ABI718_13780 [Acidobacteriota bacterium]